MVSVTKAKVNTVKTYNEIYFDARKRLKSEGIEAYSLEAPSHCCQGRPGKTKEEYVRDSVLYVNDGFEEKVTELINRRLSGEPVAYITGEWEFYGLAIEVTPDVLIPRIDTEYTGGYGHSASEDPRVGDKGSRSVLWERMPGLSRSRECPGLPGHTFG